MRFALSSWHWRRLDFRLLTAPSSNALPRSVEDDLPGRVPTRRAGTPPLSPLVLSRDSSSSQQERHLAASIGVKTPHSPV